MIRNNPRLKLLTMTRVTAVSGGKGDFTATLRTEPRHVNANCGAFGMGPNTHVALDQNVNPATKLAKMAKK